MGAAVAPTHARSDSVRMKTPLGPWIVRRSPGVCFGEGGLMGCHALISNTGADTGPPSIPSASGSSSAVDNRDADPVYLVTTIVALVIALAYSRFEVAQLTKELDSVVPLRELEIASQIERATADAKMPVTVKSTMYPFLYQSKKEGVRRTGSHTQRRPNSRQKPLGYYIQNGQRRRMQISSNRRKQVADSAGKHGFPPAGARDPARWNRRC